MNKSEKAPTNLVGMQTLAEPVDLYALQEDIDRLISQDNGALASLGGLEVYLALSKDIPSIMQEIGRLREKTFREVAEGTGKPEDIDEFDAHYLHLFLWDPKEKKIAGAYRIGCTDTILAEQGMEGLVTASCFELKREFIDYLDPAIELGRAFIIAEYQRSMYPLSLLWKGIGELILRAPRYQKLFGSVSISDDYTRISKDIIVRYMRRAHKNKTLAPWVKPLNAYQEIPEGMEISDSLENIKQVSARLSGIEPDGKGVPILLKQYLKLNATLLEFNIDPDFNNTLDALLLVELRNTPKRILEHYLGKAGCQAVLNASTSS